MDLALRSKLLVEHGVPHGFSLRTGGVSLAPYATLNLGRAVGDNLEHVEVNHLRLANAVGYDPARVFETSQVHGATVRVVTDADVPSAVRRDEADALVTKLRGLAVGVRIADCLPVLLVDKDAGVVGAVHAGWRGAALNVVGNALKEMKSLGASLDRIRAATGPHIRSCCFEVGDEVVTALEHVAHGASFVLRRDGEKPHVDLASVVHAQLLAAGMRESHLDDVAGCTRCDSNRFFSFRRDGKASGRHMAVIATMRA